MAEEYRAASSPSTVRVWRTAGAVHCPPEARNFLHAAPEGLTLRFWANLYRLTRVPTFVSTEGVVGGAGRLRRSVGDARMSTGKPAAQRCGSKPLDHTA
jgi:hypothetical protein